MKNLLIAICCLMPTMGIAQTVTPVPENKVEILKAEAARKAEEAKRAAEEAKRAAEEALKAAEAAEQATQATQQQKDSWTIPQQTKQQSKPVASKTTKSNEGYLAGAVPEKGGKVTFELKQTIKNMDADEIYKRVYNVLDNLAHDSHQMGNSCIALVNEAEHTIAAKYGEWLVFSQNLLSLDRTKFNYTIIAKCQNEQLELTLSRINYNYEEDRPTGFKATAEELITDKVALNKNGTKLQSINAKFRTKTIDRVNEIFNEIKQALK